MIQRSATIKQSGPRFKFIGDTIGELKKVVWLSRREAAYLSVLVLIVCIIVGLILGIIDYAFSRLVGSVFLGG